MNLPTENTDLPDSLKARLIIGAIAVLAALGAFALVLGIGPARRDDDDQVDETPPPVPRRRKAKATPTDAPQDVPPAPAGDQ